jgi:predicted phosphodiesterase
MKIAVLSCIHGNLEALETVLNDIEAQGCDRIICLGDLVGYGPYPNEVVDRIRSLDIPTVQGCWDEDIVEGLNACECSYPSLLAEKRGLRAHEWTNQVVRDDVREYLAQLPLSLRVSLREGNLCFVHGSPNSQHEYLMPELDSFIALERVLSSQADVLFCGHTHIPYVRSLDDANISISVKQIHPKSSQSTPIKQSLSTPIKRLVNAGSVGEPRHGRPNATYVIYDSQNEAVGLREIPYDYKKTCAAIIEQGLPKIFAWRLSQGLEFAEQADDPQHLCQR